MPRVMHMARHVRTLLMQLLPLVSEGLRGAKRGQEFRGQSCGFRFSIAKKTAYQQLVETYTYEDYSQVCESVFAITGLIAMEAAEASNIGVASCFCAMLILSLPLIFFLRGNGVVPSASCSAEE